MAMHVTFRQLRVFEAVARHLSFSRAAEELYLSQPGVSMQIKQLEQNVGLPLFEQLGKKIFLTEAGRELFHYSRAIAQQLGELEEAIDALKGLRRGSVRVATISSTANYFAPRLLARFIERYSTVSVNLQVSNRETVIRQLMDNETDLAIMGRPPEGMPIVAEAFLENPLVLVAPPDHPLAGQRDIPLARIAKEPFLIREPGSGTRNAMERFLKEHGITPIIAMEINSNEAIKQAVHMGMGLSVLSLYTVVLEVETGRLAVLEAEGFPVLRHWYVVCRENKRLSSAAQAFREFLITEAQNLVESGPACPLPQSAPAQAAGG